MIAPSTITAFQLSVRAAAAAALSLAIAEFLGLQYPIYAMLSAVIVSDLSSAQTQHLGLQRLMGSVLGALIGAVVSHYVVPSPWSIGFSILITMFLSHLLHWEGTNKIAGYVCGIALLHQGVDPWGYAFWRLAETILGIVVAIAVSFVPKLLDASKQEKPNPGE